MATTKSTRSTKATTAKAKVQKAAAKRQPKATKAQVKGNAKFGAQRQNVRRRVVSMRDKKNLSWAAIASELGVAPRTARRLYNEVKGEGAHHGLLAGKGGRRVAS